MKKFLSLGAGVQSSTLALMCAKGEIPAPDAAIFADTQWEPKAVYDWLNYLEKQLPFPVYRVTAGSLRDGVLKSKNLNGGRFASIPWFTGKTLESPNGGMGRRQCTSEYKINPLRRKMRELVGPPQRQIQCEVMIGISTDEAHRMKPARNQWQRNIWPLIDRGMSRGDCLAWMAQNGYPTPPKSSCLGCPYHSDQQWREIKANPEEWADVVAIDRVIRKPVRGMKPEQYMHRSFMPIDEAPFNDDRQADMFGNECEGMCGV